jgi:AraC family transcriptional regulator
MMSLARASQAGGSELYADAAAHFLAHHLLRFHSQEHLTRPVRREDKRMMLVDDLLRGSLSSKITLAELASVAGLSKFHLLRTFKLAFGETPSQRLTRYRMAEAKRLLAKTSLAVSEISLECGYDNPAHFAYAFRRAYGLSPREYRHKVQ